MASARGERLRAGRVRAAQVAEGDRASAACHVRALHYSAKAKGGTEWEVLGHYLFELTRSGSEYRITKMTLETFHQTGNRSLLSEANVR